ncbi:hypothetical protein AYD12_005049 [Escherichia coli]|uniref:hypothetical protein n=1 Tax=Escherichia coli TaxID=562 RepID=UPI000BDF7A8F|nr:hypothetical protein [Escherichia coli]EFH4119698.1 hypothetical protein [Escherichia coli]EFK1598151.1 hypothetical protein [Escherichia coli]EFM2236242.1 hypothetical protein [Escherichia coli]EGO9579865.1 hypothetical protein [Escherichia coli]QFF95524.1 hypothetical protein FTO72_14125 [Escherichia coli]
MSQKLTKAQYEQIILNFLTSLGLDDPKAKMESLRDKNGRINYKKVQHLADVVLCNAPATKVTKDSDIEAKKMYNQQRDAALRVALKEINK